jgi:hypothetical protein
VTNEDLLIWGFGLIGAAFALAILELFIPSGGIIAVTASVVAIGGVVAFWQVSWVWGVTALLGSIIAGIVLFQFALKVMPYTPVGRGLILGGPDDEEEIQRRREQDAAPLPRGRARPQRRQRPHRRPEGPHRSRLGHRLRDRPRRA